MADWIKIRNEYINGNISYRKLADKHGISFNTLKDIAVKEKWYDLRKEQHNKIKITSQQKTADKLAEKEANRLLRISDAADKLLEKIEEATKQLDQYIVTNRAKQKTIKYSTAKAGFGKPSKEVIKEIEQKQVVKAGHLDRLGLKQLASALKDLKDIQLTQGQEDNTEPQNPVININIRPAQPIAEEGEGEGE